MMTRRALVGVVAVVWAGAAVAVACGDSSSDAPANADGGSGGDGSTTPTPTPPPGNPPPPASYVAAPAGAGKAYCDGTYGNVEAYLNRCCDATDKTTSQFGLAYGLIAGFGSLCDRFLEDSIAKGRLLYDPVLAAQCDSVFAPLATSAACGSELAAVIDPTGATACQTAFNGTQTAGQPCGGTYECQRGLTCVGNVLPTKLDAGIVEGTCQAPPAIGQPCGQAKLDGGGATISVNYPFQTKETCAAGAYCPSTSGATCAAQKTAGTSCFDKSECTTGHCYLNKCDTQGPVDAGACTGTDDCNKGLYCDQPDAAGPGSCTPKKAATSSCKGAFGSECKGRCAVPDGGTTGTCASFCGSG